MAPRSRCAGPPWRLWWPRPKGPTGLRVPRTPAHGPPQRGAAQQGGRQQLRCETPGRRRPRAAAGGGW
eukprot:15477582-Alexandrium_andersonii.AAC.1